MISGSRSPHDFVLPRWIRPFHRCWKPLTWIWGAILIGVFINVGSSWLIAKRFDPTGTPLGWLASHLWITLPPLFLLVLLTLLAGLASLQENAVSPASPHADAQAAPAIHSWVSARVQQSIGLLLTRTGGS